MLNFDKFSYNKALVPQDQSKKEQFFKDLQQQFYEEISASEEAKEYFSKYYPTSVDSFIQSYASKKAHLTKCYEYYERLYSEKEITSLEYQKKAENMLIAILQKKLFNIQLQWRAGKIDIDEINISYDFRFWEDHVMSCPFIPAITEHEVELIKDYLMQDNDDQEFDEYGWHSWQDYNQIMQKDERGLATEMPNWYEFYDLRMGSGQLLVLPNIKGEKEDFYFELNRQESQRKNPQTNYSPIDPRPILVGFGNELVEFSQYFESDEYFIELFKFYDYSVEKERRDPNHDDITEAIDVLLTADRPVYFSKQMNWDNAIIDAAKRYTNTRIIESIDFVFEEYQMMKELGISKYKSEKEIRAEYIKDEIVKIYRKAILDGRKLNGEPEDFNY